MIRCTLERLHQALPLLLGIASVSPITACGPRDRRAADATLTVLISGPGGDERVLGLPYDNSPKFLVFLPLTAEGRDGTLEPRLAQSWHHSPAYRQWTVRLRSDVRWHDSVPVTAHDVKFTLDLMGQVGWAGPDDYDVRVLDDTTYTIAYRRRGPGNPLDTWTVFYPKHLLEHLDPAEFASWEFWVRPVGNGPYRYVRHLPGVMTELKTNPDYYRSRPRIGRAVLKFGGQPLAELLAGNVDVVLGATEADLLKVANDLRFRTYHAFAWFAAQTLVWNHRHPAFRDRRVRRALTLAIDRHELLQALNLPRETPLSDVLHTDGQFQRGETPTPLPFDPAEAARLLEEAGWRDRDGDGIRERDGRPFRFSVLVPSAFGSERSAVYVQSQLRRVGIVMEIETLEIRALFARVRRAAFEAVLADVHMRGERGGGGLHFEEDSPIGYVNPQVASRLRRTRSAFDPAEVDRLYRETWPIFQADVPVTFLHPLVRTTIAHRRVRGLESPDRIDPLADIEAVWLEPERR